MHDRNGIPDSGNGVNFFRGCLIVLVFGLGAWALIIWGVVVVGRMVE